MDTMQRSECESDQPERYGHLRYGFVAQCRFGGRVPQVLGEYGSKPEVSIPRRLPAVCSGYLGARGAMVQPFFFCASTHANHSIEPGWGTF